MGFLHALGPRRLGCVDVPGGCGHATVGDALDEARAMWSSALARHADRRDAVASVLEQLSDRCVRGTAGTTPGSPAEGDCLLRLAVLACAAELGGSHSAWLLIMGGARTETETWLFALGGQRAAGSGAALDASQALDAALDHVRHGEAGALCTAMAVAATSAGGMALGDAAGHAGDAVRSLREVSGAATVLAALGEDWYGTLDQLVVAARELA